MRYFIKIEDTRIPRLSFFSSSESALWICCSLTPSSVITIFHISLAEEWKLRVVLYYPVELRNSYRPSSEWYVYWPRLMINHDKVLHDWLLGHNGGLWLAAGFFQIRLTELHLKLKDMHLCNQVTVNSPLRHLVLIQCKCFIKPLIILTDNRIHYINDIIDWYFLLLIYKTIAHSLACATCPNTAKRVLLHVMCCIKTLVIKIPVTHTL